MGSSRKTSPKPKAVAKAVLSVRLDPNLIARVDKALVGRSRAGVVDEALRTWLNGANEIAVSTPRKRLTGVMLVTIDSMMKDISNVVKAHRNALQQFDVNVSSESTTMREKAIKLQSVNVVMADLWALAENSRGE